MNLSSNTILTNSPNRGGANSNSGSGGGGGAAGDSTIISSSPTIPATNGQQQQHQQPHPLTSSSSSAAILTGAGTPPTPGGKYSVLVDGDNNVVNKKHSRSSLQVLLPKLPSSDSLSNSPGPASPGLPNWTDSSPKLDGNSSEKLSDAANKLNRKESYKAQRKNYRREKKRVASELLSSLQDPAIIVLADWLKVRGTLKSWTKLWCVLKPGLLLLYKSPKTKSNHWVGTVLLTSCQIIERPSKKDGFCFKLFHPLDQSIWAPRGPDKETIGAVVQPLPTAYLIFRAPSQAAGKCWMDALELSLKCSALLLRSASGCGGGSSQIEQTQTVPGSGQMTHETQWSEADYEKHFNEHDVIPNKRINTQKPVFLAKYIPPTPPPSDQSFRQQQQQQQQQMQQQKNKNQPKTPQSPQPQTSDDSCSIPRSPRSPCPSPTPLLQQLYLAVSQWERMFSESPNAIRARYRNIKRLENIRDEREDDTDDERSYDNSPSRTSLSVSKEDLDIDSQTDLPNAVMSGLESDSESDVGGEMANEEECIETVYEHCQEEEFGAAGEQVEELADEHKSLIWFLVKQVRPGMDLSKVVLPTFILEPRSFLDKLSDSYYHADYLSKAVLEDDPFNRMKLVIKWYLSGFYKKPKGLKKPYNPILGETFRCFWQHDNGSRTFYIAEQVSHHPPISAFYVTNRQDGFSISCSMLAKSKFYGNSTSAILDGKATLTLLPRGESYTLTIPYAHCKGILMGTLSMELGGKISVECEYTGYRAEIEFKLKPFLGGVEYTNVVSGRLKLGKETLATINGHWDGEMRIKDSRSGEDSILFCPTQDVRGKRLKRHTVPMQSQASNESELLWQHVSAAIYRDDQQAATEEKTVLEESQRAMAKERLSSGAEWIPTHFQQDIVTGQWHYKWADLRPWDLRNDLRQYESNYKILTKTKHQAPIVRTASLISSEPIILQADSRSSLAALKKSKHSRGGKFSNSIDIIDGSDSSDDLVGGSGNNNQKIVESISNINKKLEEQSKKLAMIQINLDKLTFAPPRNDNNSLDLKIQSIIYIVIGLVLQLICTFLMTRKSN